MKKKLITTLSIMFMLTTCAIASDLVIESDTQSYNEKESKIKYYPTIPEEYTYSQMKLFDDDNV